MQPKCSSLCALLGAPALQAQRQTHRVHASRRWRCCCCLCCVLQACDDSTREDVKLRIDAKVAQMQQRGHHCLVTRRAVNKGFKAGNMINGMSFLNEVGIVVVAC